MEQALKQRLIGASVIIALAVIFVPMLFDRGYQQGSQTVSIKIPEEPEQLIQKRIQLDKPMQNSTNNPADTHREQKVENVELTKPISSITIPAQQEKVIEIIENNLKPDTLKNDVKVVIDQVGEKVVEAPDIVKNDIKLTTENVTSSVNSKYQVRLGAFSQKQNAEKLKSNLIQAGLDASVYFDDEKKLHTVVSKLMNNMDTAESYANSVIKLEQKIGKPTILEVDKEQIDTVEYQIASGFVVQLGSFSSKENALKLRDDLRKSDFVSFVDSIKNSKNEDRFRVRVGPFVDQKDAKANQAKLKRIMNKESLIKPHEQNLVIES